MTCIRNVFNVTGLPDDIHPIIWEYIPHKKIPTGPTMAGFPKNNEIICAPLLFHKGKNLYESSDYFKQRLRGGSSSPLIVITVCQCKMFMQLRIVSLMDITGDGLSAWENAMENSELSGTFNVLHFATDRRFEGVRRSLRLVHETSRRWKTVRFLLGL